MLLLVADPARDVGSERAGSGVTLLGYLDLFELSPEGRGSRSQVVFLRSMAVQYPQLRVRLIDVSGRSESERRNRVHDWGLAELRVEALTTGDAPGWAGATPTTVLLDASGETLARWEGFVAAAELDLTIQAGASRTGPAASRVLWPEPRSSP